MALLSWFGRPKLSENPLRPLTPEVIYGDAGINRNHLNGIDTSPDGAMAYAPAKACEDFIVNGISTLPLHLYRPEGDGKARATEHPLYNLLTTRPNGYQTPAVFKADITRKQLRKGVAYVYTELNKAGDIANLLVLDNNRVTEKYIGGGFAYTYRNDSGEYAIEPELIIRILGHSDDGIFGKPVLFNAEKTIGLGLLAEDYGLRYFAEGETGGQHIELESWPTEPQMEMLKKSTAHWAANRHATKIVPAGKLVSDGYSNQESQFLELRKFQLLESARLYAVSPQAIGHYENGGTYANLEAQSIDEVRKSLLTWITKQEQAFNAALFPERDFFVAYLIEARLRGDTASRYATYAIGIDKGWLTIPEIRAMENLPPLPKPPAAPAPQPAPVPPAPTNEDVQPPAEGDQ